MLRLSICLPSYNNFTEVYYTVQSLRMYHNLKDCEIWIIDNYGDPELEKFARAQGGGIVRYSLFKEGNGPAAVKNRGFELAKGEMVLCIDSHVMLKPGALDNIPVTDDLIQGPLMYCDIKNYTYEWLPIWRGNMWGIWGKCVTTLPQEPFEIWGCGCGCFATKKSSWLKFCSKYRGFGGEEGIIHEKYRKAGRKVICLPSLVWMHQFDRKIPHQVLLLDRVINYIVGFDEIGLDKAPIKEHFGEKLYNEALAEAVKR